MEGHVNLLNKLWNGRGLVDYLALYSFNGLFNRIDQVMPIPAVSDNITRSFIRRHFMQTGQLNHFQKNIFSTSKTIPAEPFDSQSNTCQ